MLRLVLIAAFAIATGAAVAGEPPPEMRRPLAGGERYWHPPDLCRQVLRDSIPTPATYQEIRADTVWPHEGPDAALELRLYLKDTLAGDFGSAHLAAERERQERRDWAITFVQFDAQNIYGATVRTVARCFVAPIFAKEMPAVDVAEVAGAERCRIKSLCGRP